MSQWQHLLCCTILPSGLATKKAAAMASNLMLLRPHKELLPEVRLFNRLPCTLILFLPFQSLAMLEGMHERGLDVTCFLGNVLSSIDSVQCFARIAKKKYRGGGSFTCMYKHLCAGQVPLTDAEAQALKESRQRSASQDWLMGADPIEHETVACQDSG